MTEDPAQREPHSAVSGLPQVTKLLAGVVAPTTLVTGLLFYFGWMHAYWFFQYFGVHSTLLGLTTVDFVMRSADALFVPMTVLACGSLLMLWAHAALRTRLAAGSRPLLMRRLVPILTGIGLLLTLGGLASVFRPTLLDRRVALAPLCLGGGVLLLLYAVRLGRALRPAGRSEQVKRPPEWIAVGEWAGVFVLVSLSLFWAATDYSAAVGRSQARRYAAELSREPEVALYSERSLRLRAPGVREVRCQDPEATYRFRYDGLKFMLQSGEQYVLIPEQWSRATGAAFVIPRTDTLRLEFFPAAATTAPATC
ncbi:hypothetical protein WEI85_21550 [Actinomycetes bacterium KLBMP 9797]